MSISSRTTSPRMPHPAVVAAGVKAYRRRGNAAGFKRVFYHWQPLCDARGAAVLRGLPAQQFRKSHQVRHSRRLTSFSTNACITLGLFVACVVAMLAFTSSAHAESRLKDIAAFEGVR